MKRLETIVETAQVGLDKAGRICYGGRSVFAFAPLKGDWINLSTIAAYRLMKSQKFVRIAILTDGRPEGELDDSHSGNQLEY